MPLAYATPGPNVTRGQLAVLPSLVSKNMKNLPLKARKLIITREGEEATVVGPGCRLSKQFLGQETSDISDLKKTVVISRKVKDPVSGTVFCQLQFMGQQAIDPVRSAAVGNMPDKEWNGEVEPLLQLIIGTIDAEGNVTPTPLEKLPTIYEFLWLKERPQQAGDHPNGRPARAKVKTPTPKPEVVTVKSEAKVSPAAAKSKSKPALKKPSKSKSRVRNAKQVDPSEDEDTEEEETEVTRNGLPLKPTSDTPGPTTLTLDSIKHVVAEMLKSHKQVNSDPKPSTQPTANVSSVNSSETETEKAQLQAQAKKVARGNNNPQAAAGKCQGSF